MRRRVYTRIVAAAIFAIPTAIYVNGCIWYENDPALNGRGMCVPTKHSGPIADECGIFVSRTGNDTNEGSKAAPVKTLGRALTLVAAGRAIYVCNGKYDEEVDITKSVHLYGGLDCTDGTWTYQGPSHKTELTTKSDATPLRLEGQIDVMIQNFHVVAQNATQEGGSSIAVIAEGARAKFVGCELEAGNGAQGPAGEVFAGPAKDGESGRNGTPACVAKAFAGVEGPITTCPDDKNSGGGRSGNNSGSSGSQGWPGTVQNGGRGAAQTGACEYGKGGVDGSSGSVGIRGTGLGTIGKDGYTGVPGHPGTRGQPGQGGGGGGGDMLWNLPCPSGSQGYTGASGGSGGSGACGGEGGRGGGPGGASIAMLSLHATLAFQSTRIVAKNGGAGGLGGEGQSGGKGGNGGGGGFAFMVGRNVYPPGCAGGLGGKGGNGGVGGDGSHGPSIGIAYTGIVPTVDENAVNISMNNALGIAAKLQNFPQTGSSPPSM